MITSLGYHTSSIFLRLTFAEALELYRDCKKYKAVKVRPIGKDEKNHNAFPKGYIIEYHDKDSGISWYIRLSDELSNVVQP